MAVLFLSIGKVRAIPRYHGLDRSPDGSFARESRIEIL